MNRVIAGKGRPQSARRALVSVVSLLLFLATASCAQSAASTRTAGGNPGGVIVVTGAASVSAGAEAPTTVTRVASRDDLVGEQRILPDSVQIDPRDPSRVVVRFAGGDPSCHGARVAIDEQPATVRVLLFVGELPHGAAGCTAGSTTVELVATLAHDLGTRELVWQR